MAVLKRFTDSSIGSKSILALTGVLLILFLLGHLSGNLLIFVGRDAFNAYPEKLRELGPLLWVARIGILVVFVAHIILAIRLTRQNRAARPVPYAKHATIQASFASTHMIHTGLLLLAFVVFHLAHYTFRITSPEVAAHGPYEVYEMLVQAFADPLVSLTYIAAMIVLGLHISHGIPSLFQSLGLNHPLYNRCIRTGGRFVGWAIAALYLSIPVAIWLGIVG